MDGFIENNQLQEKREEYINLQQEKTIEATSDTAIPESLNEFKQKAGESRLNKGELKQIFNIEYTESLNEKELLEELKSYMEYL